MKRLAVLFLLVVCALISIVACRESVEIFNGRHDILVRNTAEGDVWIKVDGEKLGRVDNNGIAEVVWEGEEDDVHTIQAFRSADYDHFHCEVQTTYLDHDEDFYWYLLQDERFEGTKDGRCNPD